MTSTPLRCAFTRFVTAAALAGAAALAHAHSYTLGDIDIGHPWARPTVAGQSVGGGYLKLSNKGQAADKLVSATVDAGVAQRVELHTMSMDGNMMRMREVDAIDVPVGKTVELAPGGMHLMFIGLKAPLKAGDSFPLTLKFQKAGEVKVDVKVEVPKEGAAPKPATHEHKH